MECKERLVYVNHGYKFLQTNQKLTLNMRYEERHKKFYNPSSITNLLLLEGYGFILFAWLYCHVIHHLRLNKCYASKISNLNSVRSDKCFRNSGQPGIFI